MSRGPREGSAAAAPLDERRRHGRALREQLPRAAQGRFEPARRRLDPVAILERANRPRIPPLAALKTNRMAASPFAFFRGAAPVMAEDLARLPRTGLLTQICGDAHVRNLGAFAAPDGHLVFDVNDFDETTVGPWEWDLKRLATSLVLAGREAGSRAARIRDAVAAFVAAYRGRLDELSQLSLLELLRVEERQAAVPGVLGRVFGKAERLTSARLLERLTVERRGRPAFHDRRPQLYHVPDATAGAVLGSLASYRQTLSPDRQLVLDAYRPVDVAFKVVGTGSVGTRDYVVLLLGCRSDDALFLQVKEELPSCYVGHLGGAAVRGHQGRRVAEGQHRMQTVTDPLLGWTSVGSHEFLVRQLADHKASLEPGDLVDDVLVAYAGLCGRVLAKGHARTGDAGAIAGYCGRGDALDRAITGFALAYAEQTEADHARLCAAIRGGEIESASEPRLRREWRRLASQS